ncbi:MAG: MATE family efflux transporter [Eggerthellaceae bacterium]
MSQHFSVGHLLRYTSPSIAMMIFASVYIIVDGLFVSNFIGATALAAVNFVYPIPMILATVGFMLGTGGSAVVAKTLGEGRPDKANEYFSLIVYAAIVFGVSCSAIGLAVLKPVLAALGASGNLLDASVLYGTILLLGIPGFVLQYAFQSLVMTAGKPKLGFISTLVAGCLNIGLDALFIIVFGWGLAGAAWASIIGMAAGGIVPLIYFARKNTSLLKLGKTKLELRILGKSAVNGSSEMVSNIAMSVVSIVYNVQLLHLIGESGVAAYGVIQYVAMIFAAVFMGYSMGAGPLMSFQYGARNTQEMRSLLQKGLGIIGVFGILMFLATRVLADPLAYMYVGYDQDLYGLTAHALKLYSMAFLIMGFNIYGSSFFTALNNGLVSAIISFLRTFVFEIGSVLLLPQLIGIDGIWYSVGVAEIAALIITLSFIFALGSTYGYRPQKSDTN